MVMTIRKILTYQEVKESDIEVRRLKLHKFKRPRPGGETSLFKRMISREEKLTSELVKLRKQIQKQCSHLKQRQVLFEWPTRRLKDARARQALDGAALEWVNVSHFEIRCEACKRIIKEGDDAMDMILQSGAISDSS